MLWRWLGLLVVILSVWVNGAQGQQQGQAVAPVTTDSTGSEISTRSTGSVIKVRVDLVLVRVVVRDARGKPVPGLSQEDFQLWDNGKRQKISTFSAEAAEERVAGTEPGREVKSEAGAGAGNASAMPQRFVALVIDDLHMKAADAMAVHDATKKLFASLTPTDRVAIYSTEGSVRQDFTDDAETLRKSLAAIVPHPRKGEAENYCPNVSYYQADLIVNKHDREAAQIAAVDAEVNHCPVDVEQYAQRILQTEDSRTREGYENLGEMIGHLAGMPGQRVLVYVSPGFVLADEFLSNESGLIERALRTGVVINTIDARGLYTAEVLPDINAPPQVSPYKSSTMDYQGAEGTYRMQAQFVSGQVLAELAANTGGTYFHNRNDLDVGMSQALAAPDVSYMLGFTPQKSTVDGKFHTLKVKVAGGKTYQIQATNGYYASKMLVDPESAAQEEVREALFSQGETVSIPVQVTTEILKTDATSPHLTVHTNLDISGLRFREADGRSCNDVVLATGVFNTNGRLVDGQMKEIALKLTDSTLAKMRQAGLPVDTTFTLKPGTYVVRSVVRGSEGDQLTARNLTTVVPGKQPKQNIENVTVRNLQWAPPSVDVPVKSLSTVPACDLSGILEQAAASSLAFTSNLEKFTAQEHIDYTVLNRSGMVKDHDSGSFQYVYWIEQQRNGAVSRENRTPVKGSHAFRESEEDIGEGAIAAIFGPDLQTDYEMKCEGMDERNGELNWVIHFEQRKDRPSRTASFWVNGAVHQGMLKGRAWISKENFQVSHLEANLMGEIADIELQEHALSVDYGLVGPPSGNLGIWLPIRIATYWKFPERRIISIHTFADFQLFTIETTEKVKEPNQP